MKEKKENDKTLDLSDIEIDKTVKLDKTDLLELRKKEINEKVLDLLSDKSSKELEQELEEGIDLRKKKKKRGYHLILFSIFFVPGLIFLLIVGSHSNMLITKTVMGIIYFLLGLCFGLFVIGLVFYLKNKNIIVKTRTNIGKYLYFFVFIMYTLFCIALTILLYGPSPEFKDWLVTTAMNTKDHKYYCQWFYNDKEIDEVFSRNYIEEPDESTDDTPVTPEPEEKIEYENEYEEAILTKEEGNEDYKIITFDINGCKGYLAVIYDPSLVKVTTTDKIGVRGQYVTTMAKREKALVAINGAGFYDPGYSSSGGSPRGVTIVNGKIVTNNQYGKVTTGGIVGMTKDNKLVLLKNTTANQALEKGVRDAVSWGPFLIVNGKAAYTRGNGGWGYAARTAIGQRADGIVLFLVVDSNYNRTKGANMVDMTEIMQKYGAINAANLDGGTSSVMVVNGELISNPIDSELKKQTRPIATAFIAAK